MAAVAGLPPYALSLVAATGQSATDESATDGQAPVAIVKLSLHLGLPLPRASYLVLRSALDARWVTQLTQYCPVDASFLGDCRVAPPSSSADLLLVLSSPFSQATALTASASSPLALRRELVSQVAVSLGVPVERLRVVSVAPLGWQTAVFMQALDVKTQHGPDFPFPSLPLLPPAASAPAFASSSALVTRFRQALKAADDEWRKKFDLLYYATAVRERCRDGISI